MASIDDIKLKTKFLYFDLDVILTLMCDLTLLMNHSLMHMINMFI